MRRSLIGPVAAVLAILLIAGPFAVVYRQSVDYVTVTVTDKGRTTGDDGHWIVFTDGEVFANKDSLLFMKFRSSDVQGSITVGETHTFKVAGWRIPVISRYRNILEVE